jgi:ribosomal protein S18 acetylase RimI-like enzyme
MIIRKAEKSDIKVINQLYWDLDSDAISFQPKHFQRSERPKDYFLDIINNPKSDFLLAALNDEVIGFSLLYEKEAKGLDLLIPCKYAYIQDFIIAERYRNCGFGSQLFEASKQWAKAHDMEYLRLSAFPANSKAIRFYKRHGLALQMVSMECAL